LSTTYDMIVNITTLQLNLIGLIPYTDSNTNVTTTYYAMRQTWAH